VQCSVVAMQRLSGEQAIGVSLPIPAAQRRWAAWRDAQPLRVEWYAAGQVAEQFDLLSDY